MTADNFISEFTYNKGPTFIEGWQNISDTKQGDCNHFSWTVLVLEEGSVIKALLAVLTFKAVFWLTKSPSNGLLPRHTVLYYRPKGWIDSTERVWRETSYPHKKRLPLLFPWVWLRVLWGAMVKAVF